MNPQTVWSAEQQRLVEHLKFVGYRTDGTVDPNGWLFATNPMAPGVGFRAGPNFLCLHADYPTGHSGAAVHRDLLREVNRLNAIHWLVRCTLVTHESGANRQFSIRLQANLPLGLAAEELGACLFAWIRESTYIERAARLWAWASDDAAIEGDHSRDAIDDRPTQAT